MFKSHSPVVPVKRKPQRVRPPTGRLSGTRPIIIAAEYLVPFGFTPDQYRAAEEERLIFLPAGDLGYLEYTPPAARYADQTAFDLDNSVAEANEADPRLANLEKLFGSFMKGNLCRCQLCDPGFGDAKPEVA